jgi:ferrous iron transport protein A
MPALCDLHKGQKARVDGINGDDAITQRLMEMGLLEGDVIELVGFAPLGDPLEIRLHDYCLSLRKSEAARIQVQVLSSES